MCKATIDTRKRIGDAVGRAMRVFDDPALTQKVLAKRSCILSHCMSVVCHGGVVRRMGCCREAPKSAVAFRQAPQEAAGSSVLSVTPRGS